MPWSRIRIFRSERTRSTPLDSKLMFWCVLYYLDAFGPFGCLTKLNAKWAKLMQKFVPWSHVGIFHNKPLDPPHWTLTSCFVVFHTIWVHLGQFVALPQSVQNGPNWCKSSCHEVASEFFIANTPDPPHWTLNWCFFCFVLFGCIWTVSLPYKTQCKTGRPGAKVRATESGLKFSRQHTRLSPLGHKLIFWCVSTYLGTFSIVWLPYKTQCKTA